MSFVWPPGLGIPGWVLEKEQTYLTNDAEHDACIRREMREQLGLRNVLCVPIFDIPRTKVIGFFALHNKTGGFDQEDVNTAEGLSKVASIAIQNALLYEKIRRAESELHRLSAQLLVSQDQERRRIARVLHEETAQDLTGVKLYLGWLSHMPDSGLPSSTLNVVNECRELAGKALEKIRTLSHDLHPAILELGGLWPAIRAYAEKFGQMSGIVVTIEIPENISAPLTKAKELTVFRVVQETLTNIHRHSGSKTASIRVRPENGYVIVEMSDSGKGICRDSWYQPTLAGLGITGMKERARQLGGGLQIESDPEHGTTIRLSLPFRRRNDDGCPRSALTAM